MGQCQSDLVDFAAAGRYGWYGLGRHAWRVICMERIEERSERAQNEGRDIDMETGKQIKKYRAALRLSQEELAEKVYVSRQTISNWENEKNYPDIHSLLRLSSLFGISLDQLIKGDVEMMKSEIKKTDIEKFNHCGAVFSVLFVAMIVTPVPLAVWFGVYGLVAWAVLAAVAVGYAFKVEKLKKTHNIQTYKEIVAFSEGKRLDEMEVQQELGKRPYQKALAAVVSAAAALAVCAVMGWLLS